jgi:hypothetical protein
VSNLHTINLTAAWTPPAAGRPEQVWRRQFGLPTGLARGDRVWLRVDSPGGCRIVLNEAVLAVGPPLETAEKALRHEVTSLLGRRNELLLIARGGPDGPPRPTPRQGRQPLPATLGTVVLEIESSA